MATIRQQRFSRLIWYGYLPSEAMELSRISKAGLKAPYLQHWMRSRKRLYDNMKRYNWTDQQYRDYIKQQYIDIGAIKTDKLGRRRFDVWAMLRHYEELAFRRAEEYESPWRRKTKQKGERKRAVKRTTRRQALQSWISQLDKTISRTTSESRKQRLTDQRNNLQKQLDSL